MLFAGWEVRIVKNCDRGLENEGKGKGKGTIHSRTKIYLCSLSKRPGK